MGENPSRFSDCESCPVENISWDDIQEFIEELNRLSGKRYRLPTEAEWEFAARGGTKSRGYKYAGSNDIKSIAWYSENSNIRTYPVGSKLPNELGIYDMTGNIYELCSDWYGNYYYSNSTNSNPLGPSSGRSRVLRGGSWDHNSRICRVSCRNFDMGFSSYGFRLVLEP
jgi:formylglycine-generating enzyme required for sulfatase activity